MKSLPMPVAVVRRDLADVIESARRGQRIRVTRHGKPVAWIIGEEEHERLGDDEVEAETRTTDGDSEPTFESSSELPSASASDVEELAHESELDSDSEPEASSKPLPSDDATPHAHAAGKH